MLCYALAVRAGALGVRRGRGFFCCIPPYRSKNHDTSATRHAAYFPHTPAWLHPTECETLECKATQAWPARASHAARAPILTRTERASRRAVPAEQRRRPAAPPSSSSLCTKKGPVRGASAWTVPLRLAGLGRRRATSPLRRAAHGSRARASGGGARKTTTLPHQAAKALVRRVCALPARACRTRPQRMPQRRRTECRSATAPRMPQRRRPSHQGVSSCSAPVSCAPQPKAHGPQARRERHGVSGVA